MLSPFSSSSDHMSSPAARVRDLREQLRIAEATLAEARGGQDAETGGSSARAIHSFSRTKKGAMGMWCMRPSLRHRGRKKLTKHN